MRLPGSVVARTDPGEYWQHVMKDEPMPQFIQGLVGVSKVASVSSNNHQNYKEHCHSSLDRPSAAADIAVDDQKDKVSYTKDFEPEPTATAYTDGVKKGNKISYTKDLEPEPTATAYTDGVKKGNKNSCTKDFEPEPTATAYTDGVKKGNKISYTEDFEPEPTLSAYVEGDKDKSQSMPKIHVDDE
ncbi:uncharacterized protein LOC142505307 [Primulina tabacum]|uniref:uncharacterized protein LOC142505307 n=1 Tax=Primulina tabacum TaxID=48773 RepID=UPI003F5954F9